MPFTHQRYDRFQYGPDAMLPYPSSKHRTTSLNLLDLPREVIQLIIGHVKSHNDALATSRDHFDPTRHVGYSYIEVVPEHKTIVDGQEVISLNVPFAYARDYDDSVQPTFGFPYRLLSLSELASTCGAFSGAVRYVRSATLKFNSFSALREYLSVVPAQVETLRRREINFRRAANNEPRIKIEVTDDDDAVVPGPSAEVHPPELADPEPGESSLHIYNPLDNLQHLQITPALINGIIDETEIDLIDQLIEFIALLVDRKSARREVAKLQSLVVNDAFLEYAMPRLKTLQQRDYDPEQTRSLRILSQVQITEVCIRLDGSGKERLENLPKVNLEFLCFYLSKFTKLHVLKFQNCHLFVEYGHPPELKDVREVSFDRCFWLKGPATRILSYVFRHNLRAMIFDSIGDQELKMFDAHLVIRAYAPKLRTLSIVWSTPYFQCHLKSRMLANILSPCENLITLNLGGAYNYADDFTQLNITSKLLSLNVTGCTDKLYRKLAAAFLDDVLSYLPKLRALNLTTHYDSTCDLDAANEIARVVDARFVKLWQDVNQYSQPSMPPLPKIIVDGYQYGCSEWPSARPVPDAHI